jgi:hypothetical protein
MTIASAGLTVRPLPGKVGVAEAEKLAPQAPGAH